MKLGNSHKDQARAPFFRSRAFTSWSYYGNIYVALCHQAAINKDNFNISVDGVLSIKIAHPKLVSMEWKICCTWIVNLLIVEYPPPGVKGSYGADRSREQDKRNVTSTRQEQYQEIS
ncbi:hypothetical protein POM88_011189 [Heracleum sosnowskyi]|uniref:Uncharacterized protein n=1 Tax=Heracleum sosnowskyi TaxID=360622 RepID=A0AAD8N276_9APIA|nr:hypothetical protein POM88_011189 [Heracleum sosnowskyi]